MNREIWKDDLDKWVDKTGNGETKKRKVRKMTEGRKERILKNEEIQ